MILHTGTYRALRRESGFLHNRPTTQAIGIIVKEFEETAVVTNIKRPVHHRFARSAKNIAIVSDNVAEDPNVSISCRSHELGLSYGILWRILYLDLQQDPYKIKLSQPLKPANHSQRRRYMEWVLEH